MAKRIAILCPSLTSVGGTERAVATIGDLLSEKHEVFQFSFDPPESRRTFDSAARYIPLGASARLPLILRPVTYLIEAARLRRAKRRLGIDVTISNLWRADLISVLSGGRDRKIAICHINIVGNPTNRLMLRFRPFVAVIYRRFDRVLAVTGPLLDEIRSLFGLDHKRVRVVHNCVSPSPYKRHGTNSSRTRIVWCGRMVPEKNLHVLLRVFAEVAVVRPETQLVLIGDGPLRGDIEAVARGLGLRCGHDLDDVANNLIVTGFVAEPRQVMARCTFQVLPSIAEGMGLVLVEGFTVGLPALAADCSSGGVSDVMGSAIGHRPGRKVAELTECGSLLPVPNASEGRSREAWIDAILQMIDDKSLTVQLGAGAYSRARVFSVDAMRPIWKQIVEELG